MNRCTERHTHSWQYRQIKKMDGHMDRLVLLSINLLWGKCQKARWTDTQIKKQNDTYTDIQTDKRTDGQIDERPSFTEHKCVFS